MSLHTYAVTNFPLLVKVIAEVAILVDVNGVRARHKTIDNAIDSTHVLVQLNKAYDTVDRGRS